MTAASRGYEAAMVTNEELTAFWCAGGIDPDRCYYTGWPLGGAGVVDIS